MGKHGFCLALVPDVPRGTKEEDMILGIKLTNFHGWKSQEVR